MKDPLYNIDCVVSDELPDETFFFHLMEKRHLSYSLHKTLMNSPSIYKTLKKINDSYHSNENNKNYLVFCTTRTVFMNEYKQYIVLDEVR